MFRMNSFHSLMTYGERILSIDLLVLWIHSENIEKVSFCNCSFILPDLQMLTQFWLSVYHLMFFVFINLVEGYQSLFNGFHFSPCRTFTFFVFWPHLMKNVIHIFNRISPMVIETRITWDRNLCLTFIQEVPRELLFCRNKVRNKKYVH
jgi:hypothetical protein